MTYTQWLAAFEYAADWDEAGIPRLTAAYPQHYDRYLGELLGA